MVDAADNPVDEAATIEESIAERIEESRPTEEILERALQACADPECPIYNDGDPVGYYMEAAAKLDLVNSAAGGYPVARLSWSDFGPVQRSGLASPVEGSVRAQRERRPGHYIPARLAPVGRERRTPRKLH